MKFTRINDWKLLTTSYMILWSITYRIGVSFFPLYSTRTISAHPSLVSLHTNTRVVSSTIIVCRKQTTWATWLLAWKWSEGGNKKQNKKRLYLDTHQTTSKKKSPFVSFFSQKFKTFDSFCFFFLFAPRSLYCLFPYSPCKSLLCR